MDMSGQRSVVTINPGSTSTKIALFRDDVEILRETLHHDNKDLSRYNDLWSQFDFRLGLVQAWMRQIEGTPSAIVGIGGLLRPVPSGTYLVNQKMITDAKANLQGTHASNLGCAMAFEIARQFNCPAFIVDPVSVDEFSEIARYSGHPSIERRSLSHALNIHAMARRAAKEIEAPYDEASFVIAHLGGGISIAPVLGGRIIDANDASSDGPFSPDRTGGLPLQQFISLCYAGENDEQSIRSLVMGKGGLKAYLGTNSLSDVERRIGSGDVHAKEVFEAMSYQIAKEIGAMATVLCGQLKAVVLTGGMASSALLVSSIKKRIAYLGRILVYPGEDEMLALAQGALRVLHNEEQSKEY
jgi:butyrate kinase